MILGHHIPAPMKPLAHDIVVDVVTDTGAFEALREQWNRLLDDSRAWNPFLTWEWMWAWWTHLRETAALNLVTVHASGQLIAIAPLMLVRRGLTAPARLEFLGVGAGADYLDVIVREGHEAIAVDALARWLETEQLALHLDHLPPSPASARLQLQLAQTGWTAIESSPDVCPFIELSGQSWDSYLSSVGSSHRANVRRRLRALESRFDVRFTQVVSDEERRRALDGLFRFHDQRWASCGGSSAFSTSALRAFHHDLTRSALDAGWLRLYALSLDDVLVGAMYGFARQGRFYFFQHGSDAAYAGYSLGIVLMAMTIRAAIDEGVGEFDMLYGHEPYKKLWARRERPLGRLAIFPPRLLGRWMQRRAATRQAVRTLVHRLGLKGTHDAA